ncbi:hypothetical protein K445DRAFT_20315 [Daldinia sp. EC12]|nr:hypothetical protein K445DRAFT_20315 [Daldinia sp. EC12]
MSQVVDLASVIGTWVGAGVGVIALIGIVGPVLIWLASRTERHQTLNAIGRYTNGYISPGYHLGPNIYLFQRVQAPLLTTFNIPNPFSPAIALDSTLLRDIDTKSTWILFGVLLEAYGIQLPLGDNLLVRNGKTYLPINRLWILYIGLLGRFSAGRDSKRPSSTGNTVFTLPALRYGPSEILRNLSLNQSPRLKPQLEIRTPGEPAGTLHGITGHFEILSESQRPSPADIPVLVFHPAPIIGTQETQKDVLSPKDLFLLAIGFLPLSESSCVCLVDSFDSDDIEYFDQQVDTRPPQLEHAYARDGQLETKPVKLQSFSVGQEFSNIGDTFLNICNHTWYGFEPINSNTAREAVDSIRGHTYVPANSEWVRVLGTNPEVYMLRREAQQLALALLKLPCHPGGYLLSGLTRKGAGLTLLTDPAKQLVSMMARLGQRIEILDLSQQDKQRLNRELGPAIRLLDRENGSYRAFQAIYDLDLALGDLGSKDDQNVVDSVIGILAITNAEFLVLVQQSLRNLSESTNSTVKLDMWTKTLKVPSAFGVFESFSVDWDSLCPDDPRAHETVEISHTVIVLATIRAILRCKMLSICFNADPLISTVGEWEDIIHIQ